MKEFSCVGAVLRGRNRQSGKSLIGRPSPYQNKSRISFDGSDRKMDMSVRVSVHVCRYSQIKRWTTGVATMRSEWSSIGGSRFFFPRGYANPRRRPCERLAESHAGSRCFISLKYYLIAHSQAGQPTCADIY